jgi:cytochrome c
MKSLLIAVAAAGSLMVAGGAAAQSGADLAGSKGCGTCHAADAKKVGPSWKDVAAKNKDSKDASARIVTMLKEGKGHPKVAGSDAELKALAGFALAGGK